MAIWFMYLLKSIIVAGLLSLWYVIGLRGRRMHKLNRWYLIMLLLLSNIVPFVNFHLFQITNKATAAFTPLAVLNTAVIDLKSVTNNSNKVVVNTFHWLQIIVGLVVLVSTYCTLKFIWNIKAIVKLQSKYRQEIIDGFRVVMTDLKEAPFSFYRSIYWNKDVPIGSDLGAAMFTHEKVHIQQLHTLDKLFNQLLTCIFWFNPFYWFTKKELELVHEYLADEKAISNRNVSDFAQMILATYKDGILLNQVSLFTASDISKRIKMLQQNMPASTPILRFAVLIPLTFLIAVLFSFSSPLNHGDVNKAHTLIKVIVEPPQKYLGWSKVNESDIWKQYFNKLQILGKQRNLDIESSESNDLKGDNIHIAIQWTDKPGALKKKNDFDVLIPAENLQTEISRQYGQEIFNAFIEERLITNNNEKCTHNSNETCLNCAPNNDEIPTPPQINQLNQWAATNKLGLIVVIGDITNTSESLRFTSDVEIEKICTAILNGVVATVNGQNIAQLKKMSPTVNLNTNGSAFTASNTKCEQPYLQPVVIPK